MKSLKITLLLILFILLSCFLVSCRATRQEVKKETAKITEITSNVVNYKDTLLFTPKVETTLKIAVSETAIKPGLNSNLKDRVFSQKNGNSTVKIKIVHDTIYATASCDSLAIVAKIKQQFQKENLTSELNRSNETIKTTGYTLIDVIIFFIVGFALCWILKSIK